MTFEEWWAEAPRIGAPLLSDWGIETLASCTWQAATEAERERCFQIAIGYKLHGDPLPGHRDDMVADAIACAIREAADG